MTNVFNCTKVLIQILNTVGLSQLSTIVDKCINVAIWADCWDNMMDVYYWLNYSLLNHSKGISLYLLLRILLFTVLPILGVELYIYRSCISVNVSVIYNNLWPDLWRVYTKSKLHRLRLNCSSTGMEICSIYHLGSSHCLGSWTLCISPL